MSNVALGVERDRAGQVGRGMEVAAGDDTQMNVHTTRFGVVELDEKRVISFPAGLLGFSSYKRFVLLQPDDEGVFFWLQSLDSPELAFVVTDPSLWMKGYEATIRREQMEELGMDSFKDAQVLVIVNKYDSTLTANLQGPIVINLNNHRAVQLVLADKRWTTRQAIVQVPAMAEAVPA